MMGDEEAPPPARLLHLSCTCNGCRRVLSLLILVGKLQVDAGSKKLCGQPLRELALSVAAFARPKPLMEEHNTGLGGSETLRTHYRNYSFMHHCHHCNSNEASLYCCNSINRDGAKEGRPC